MEESKKNLHHLLFWRLLAYTTVGVILGYAGQTLFHSAEYQLFHAVAFVVMVALTLAFVFPWIYKRFFSGLRRVTESRLIRSHPRLRGALMAGMPCHFLASSYWMAALSSSPLIGGFLMFGHAVMTTPSLAYSWSGLFRSSQKWSWARGGLKTVIVLLMILNLCYFGARLFGADPDIEHRLLFCF